MYYKMLEGSSVCVCSLRLRYFLFSSVLHIHASENSPVYRVQQLFMFLEHLQPVTEGTCAHSALSMRT